MNLVLNSFIDEPYFQHHYILEETGKEVGEEGEWLSEEGEWLSEVGVLREVVKGAHIILRRQWRRNAITCDI